MVRMQEPSEAEKLERIMRETTEEHGLKLHVTGWSRKTYDVYLEDKKTRRTTLLARVESFATNSGEIRVFDERALDFARDLGTALEQAFSIEAVVIRQ